MEQNGQARTTRHLPIPSSLVEIYGARIGPYAGWVYCCLSSQADAQGQAALSLARLEQLSGMSRRSIVRGIMVLVGHGLVTKHIRPSGHGDADANVYMLMLGRPLSDDGVVHMAPGGALGHQVVHMAPGGALGHYPSLTGNGSEIPSQGLPVPDPSPVLDPKTSKILQGDKEGESRGGGKRRSAPRVLTSMPEDPDTQEALKQSILLSPTWQPWLVKRGLTHMDMDLQWEDFVQGCLAKDYRYSNWYAAFQKWLRSPLQATRNGRSARHTDFTLDQAIEDEKAWRASL